MKSRHNQCSLKTRRNVNAGDAMETIKIKYFTDKIEKLTYNRKSTQINECLVIKNHSLLL